MSQFARTARTDFTGPLQHIAVDEWRQKAKDMIHTTTTMSQLITIWTALNEEHGSQFLDNAAKKREKLIVEVKKYVSQVDYSERGTLFCDNPYGDNDFENDGINGMIPNNCVVAINGLPMSLECQDPQDFSDLDRNSILASTVLRYDSGHPTKAGKPIVNHGYYMLKKGTVISVWAKKRYFASSTFIEV